MIPIRMMSPSNGFRYLQNSCESQDLPHRLDSLGRAVIPFPIGSRDIAVVWSACKERFTDEKNHFLSPIIFAGTPATIE